MVSKEIGPSWSFELDAGAVPRSAVPVSVPLPIPSSEASALGPAQLLRDGRKRPIPCQLDLTEENAALVWMIPGLRAGEHQRYEVHFGRRQRQPNQRIRIQPSASGWSIADQNLVIGQFFAPKSFTPRLTLAGPTGVIAHFEAVWKPLSVPGAHREADVRHLRRSIQKVNRGPVFGKFLVTSEWVDASGGVLIHETLTIRLYAGEKATHIVDTHVRWSAQSRALSLHDPAGQAPCWRPTFRVEFARGVDGRVVSNQVGRDSDETWRRPVEGIAVIEGPVRLGMLVTDASHWPAARWTHPEPAVIEVTPSIDWPKPPLERVRLALGETICMSLRTVLGPNHPDWPAAWAGYRPDVGVSTLEPVEPA